MAEGLEWMLELDAKLEGALGMVRALQQNDEALKKVDAGLRKAEQATGHASAAHAKLGHEAQHTEGILHHLTHATLGPLIERFERIAEFEFIRRGVDALIEAPMEALHLFTELFEEMVKVSAEAERTDKSFSLLFGESQGKETLEWIEQISKYTEFTGRELKGAAQDLAKVGFEGEGLTRALAASIDMAAFNKSGEAGLSEALSSLERIKRTGQVTNRSLGGLGIGEEDFYKELSRRTGEGTKELKKKMGEGKVAAEQSIEALFTMIGKKTGKDLGGAGVEMSTTLLARIKHLKEIPELFFEKLKGTEGFAAINDFAGRLLEIFNPEGEIAKSIQESLDQVFDAVGGKLNGIDIEGIFRNVPEAITAVTETIKTLWSAMEPLVDGFKAVAGAVDWLNEVTGTGSSSRQGANRTANRAENPELWAERDRLLKKRSDMLAAKAAGQGWTDLDKQFGPQETYADRAAREAKEAHRKIGRAAGEGGRGGLKESTPGIEAAAADQGTAAERAMRDALGIQSPSKVFEHLGRMTGDGFNRGLDKSMTLTDDVAQGAFAMPAPRGGAPGGNSIHVEINTTVNASGNGEHIAKDVSDQIRELLPGALQSAFEQMGNQAGSA